jgi:hypothetical protein
MTGSVRQPAERLAGRRADWLADSVVSGFLATVAMTIVMALAYGVARAIGDERGSTIERWFWALTHNPVTRTTQDAIALAVALNLGVGILWAIVYAYAVEHRLPGPGWRKGMLFALVPWVLSIVTFLPIMEGGIFGRDIGAGPLPVLGNLILHLVYGAVLGTIYAANLDWPDDAELDRALAVAQQRAAAIGIAIGLVVGAIGGWIIGPSLDGIAGRGMIALIGALTLGALGLLLGVFIGGDTPRDRSRANAG